MDTQNLWQNAPKKKQPAPSQDSVLEALRQLGSGVGKTVVKDVALHVGSDALAALFGSMPKRTDLSPFQQTEGRRSEIQPVPFPIRRSEVMRPPMVRVEEVNLKQQVEAVRAELKMLASSVKAFNQEIQKAVAEQPVQPGIYHLNFMERLRSIIKILREQIEDSRTWLALSANRKKQKGYWGMFKKHGTSFGLSSERSIATQAG